MSRFISTLLAEKLSSCPRGSAQGSVIIGRAGSARFEIQPAAENALFRNQLISKNHAIVTWDEDTRQVRRVPTCFWDRRG